MAQTSTLCNEEALEIRKNTAPPTAQDAVPSQRVIRNILEYSLNLEVKSSARLGHLSFLKS